MKLTAKQEAFAQAIVEGDNAADAYRRAYEVSPDTKASTIHRKAHDVLANGKVAARVAHLRDKAAKRLEITVETLIEELEEARSVAKDASQSGAMVAATLGKAKLLGLLVEKREHTGANGGPIQHEEVSREANEFRSRLSRLAARAGAPEAPSRPH